MSGMDLTGLLMSPEDEGPVSDLSEIAQADTFVIPNPRRSLNVKKQLRDTWQGNRSYGIFPLIENTGGAHEFMPDPAKSQFVVAEEMPRFAASLVHKAKVALSKGVPPRTVLEQFRRCVPADSQGKVYFAKAARELADAVGLLGTVYVDPSLFASCVEAAKVVGSVRSSAPAFVLEMKDCGGCVYKTAGRCMLVQLPIVRSVPWDDKSQMETALRGASIKLGRAIQKGESVKSFIRSAALASDVRQTQDSDVSGEVDASTVASGDVGVSDYNQVQLGSVVRKALAARIRVDKIVAKVAEKLGSLPEAERLVSEELTCVKQLMPGTLPCPCCEASVKSKVGSSLSRVLPASDTVQLQRIFRNYFL